MNTEEIVIDYAGLQTRFETLEELFKITRVPREVCVTKRIAGTADGRTISYQLAFMKHKGRWRLCARITTENIDESEMEFRPVVDCPIADRLQVVNMVADLQKAVRDMQESLATEIDQAIQMIDRVIQNWED